jgi:hypothetical protein
MNAPIDATKVSLDALQKAESLANDAMYNARRVADQTANELPVAMVVIDGAETPKGVVQVGPIIGCNDTVVWVRVPRADGTESVTSDALMSLFDVTEDSYDGLHNSLAQSKSLGLKVDRVSLVGDGMVEVNILGTPISSGACDDPRIKSQIEQTVLWYHPSVRVLLNGSEAEWRCFGDMSGECI